MNNFSSFYKGHRLECNLIAVALALIIAVSCIIIALPNGESVAENSSSDISSEFVSSEEASSEVVSSEDATSSEVTSSTPEDTTSSTTQTKPNPQTPGGIINSTGVPDYSQGGFDFNTNLDIEDNVFLDSMVYTGYNLEKHRKDGLMWVYILSAQKKGKGWLSKISYDYDGGTSGYEVNAEGKPDIAYFEKHDLVCASYVTYVYFNYLPNIAGIDTSMLTKPTNPTLANDWYKASLDWVKKGYSYEIEFDAYRNGGGEIQFKPKEEIPIGSIILCNNMNNKSSNWACHVSIYAGYKNGYHWVYHVGNDNGPEFCAMERFCYGPDPVWPLAVISTPTNIRFSASLEVEVKDAGGAPVVGAEVTVKNNANGTEKVIGTTDANGKVTADKLEYTEYTVICGSVSQTVSLTPQNNSLNKITLTQ